MSQTNSSNITPAQARTMLWRQGRIVDFLLDSNQMEIYKSLKEGKGQKHTVVSLFSRQTGKSYGLLTIAVQECLTRKNINVVFIAPRLKQARKIAKTNLTEILKTCPDDVRPKYNAKEETYVFPTTGSVIELAGFNADEVESQRGPKAHLIIVDECGFMTNLKYGLKSVLYPKLNTTKGSMILCSTLPRSQGHEYFDFIKKAEYNGTLIKHNVFECPRYTKEDIDRFAEEVGGYDSVDFKREYLNIMLTDDEYAVVPEATEELMQEIVKELPKPPYYDAYIGMDIGFKDLTVALLAYYDFKRGVVVVEDEVVMKGKLVTTESLYDTITLKEQMCWGTKKPYLRVADDNNPILLNDLATTKNMLFQPTRKDQKEAALNNLRIMIGAKKVIINPRCKTLIFHLKNATWNNKKSSYERSPDNGHYDALDALIYLVRNINFNKNPYPKDFDMPMGDWYMLDNTPRTQFEQRILDMFSPKKR